ncbi:MAG: precorrin-6A/cobalt-precorrin-6A reductase [Collinsella sp.]
MRAGSTRPTWSASFRRAHRRRRHAPFATLASGNIRAASLAVGVRCLRLARGLEALPKASCRSRRSPARRAFSENPVARFLTTGSKELAPYTRVADFSERFFVRVLPLPGAITKCIDAGFSPSHVIGMQGPFTRELNEAMLRQVGAQWLVTTDSGTVGGTAEKLAAARDAGARCIVVARPAEGGGALRFGKWKTRFTGVRALGAHRPCEPFRPRGGSPRASSTRTSPSSANS